MWLEIVKSCNKTVAGLFVLILLTLPLNDLLLHDASTALSRLESHQMRFRGVVDSSYQLRRYHTHLERLQQILRYLQVNELLSWPSNTYWCWIQVYPSQQWHYCSLWTNHFDILSRHIPNTSLPNGKGRLCFISRLSQRHAQTEIWSDTSKGRQRETAWSL